jgi:hypothetical protein
MSEKAEQIMVRLGFSDVVLTKLENEKFNGHVDIISEIDCDECDPVISSTESYLIGYEDENGRECDEDGNYFDASQIKIGFD